MNRVESVLVRWEVGVPNLQRAVDVRMEPFRFSRIRSWQELTFALRQPILLSKSIEMHLLRHGETTTNAIHLVTGSQDVALTARGERQAGHVGSMLDSHYDLAIHSTLSRSLRTLELAIQSGKVVIDCVESDARLNERSLGVLELQPSQLIEEYSRGDLSYAPQGGESYAEVAQRCLSFLLDLALTVSSVPVEKILLCGHMGPMRILLGILNEAEDSAQVLAQSFRNTEVIRHSWRKLILPLFLHREQIWSNLVAMHCSGCSTRTQRSASAYYSKMLLR